MRRLLAILLPVLVAGIVATEMAMDLDAAARNATYRVYAVTGLLAIGLYLALRWVSERAPSLAWSLALVGLSTVAVTAVAVVLAANSMFFSAHDRDVLLVVLGVGIALAAALAAAIARSLVDDLRRVQATARRVGAGELELRTDVSRADEVGDLAGAMDRMIERLETTEEERKILLASVGHDLRTPLSSLQAAIEAMEDGVVDDPMQCLSGMSKDVAYLGRLIEDLFEYARIESGRYEPRPEALELREFVDETVEVAASLARQRNVDLVVEPVGSGVVVADPSAVRRVLRNLLDNAIRHTPEGGTVTVDVGERGFTVRDEGPGFPEWFRSTAFDRFTRADDARTGSGGAGLGLAIARGLIEANGGTIVLDDHIERGASLTVTL